MQVWRYGSAIQPCKCPLCRRQITLLVPGEASLRRHHDPEVADILRQVETYNRLFGGRANGLIQVSMWACVCVHKIFQMCQQIILAKDLFIGTVLLNIRHEY